MKMNIKTNYEIIWWLLQAIILMCAYSASVEFLITGFLLLVILLISVLIHSCMIKVISYLLLVGYSFVSIIVVWLSWIFFGNGLFDLSIFFFLIPLLNLFFSIKKLYCYFVE